MAFFGGKDPFHHPFFTQPFGGLFGGRSPFDDPFFTSNFGSNSGSRNRISIQELNPDGDDGMMLKLCLTKKALSRIQMNFHQVFLMEMNEDDRMVGESLHTISKGIHDKGHSVTTKQSKDGRVDSLQTLHNLEEDELAGFEENWKTNAESFLPGWSNGFNLLEDSGANKSAWDDFGGWSGLGGWPFQSLEYYGNGGAQPDAESSEPSSHGTSRRNVPVE